MEHKRILISDEFTDRKQFDQREQQRARLIFGKDNLLLKVPTNISAAKLGTCLTNQERDDMINELNRQYRPIETPCQARNNLSCTYPQCHCNDMVTETAARPEQTWEALSAIAPPAKWLEMYAHYQQILLHEDVAGFWQENYNIADAERQILKGEKTAGQMIFSSDYKAPSVTNITELPDCYKSKNENHNCKAAPHFICGYPYCTCEMKPEVLDNIFDKHKKIRDANRK